MGSAGTWVLSLFSGAGMLLCILLLQRTCHAAAHPMARSHSRMARRILVFKHRLLSRWCRVLRHSWLALQASPETVESRVRARTEELVRMNEALRQQAIECARATEVLRASEERYRLISQNTGDVIWSLAIATGRFTFISPSIEKLTGFTAEEAMARSLQETLTSESYREVFGSLSERLAALRRNDPAAHMTTYQLGLYGKDGSVVQTEVVTTVLRDHKGAFAEILGVTRDITERKRAEDRLRESERLYHSLVENIPHNVYRKDRVGRFTFVNRLFCQTLGVSAAEILGKTDVPGFPSEIGPLGTRDDLRVMASGENSDREDEYQLPGRPKVYVHVQKIPLRSLVGKVTGLQVMFWDVTERHRLEEQLRQSQKMEAIGTLAGGIAHDFNNILQSMLGYAVLARGEMPPDSMAESCIEEVISGGERARELVSQILAFSRKSEPEKRPTRLQPIVDNTVKLLKGSLPSTISVQCTVSDTCGWVVGDSTRIHQVIMNLCTNAYHAMREQGGILEISLEEMLVDREFALTHPELSPGRFVCLMVKDTGCGMDETQVGRIFEPYFTTKKMGEGTGLGLSVVHGIVKELGGAIVVESTVGIGSCFRVFLPLCPAPERPVQVVPRTRAERSELRGSERLLLIDDEGQVVRMLGLSLRRYGYTVDTCSDGAEALDRLRADPAGYDLVVTDQTMPQITGVQLASDVRCIRADLPVILCTGYSELVDETQAKSAGIRIFLTKPFMPHVLAEAIRSVLDHPANED